MDPLGQTVFGQPGGPAPRLPLLPWDSVEWQRPRSEGAAGFYSRVRLALLQGLSQLPGASQADCLPASSRGRQPLIWAYLLPIECFLSLFLLQPQANRWGGEAREQGFQSKAFPVSAVRPCPSSTSAPSRPLSKQLPSS